MEINTPTFSELNSFKKEILHDLCSKMKLPVSGKKGELISRLQSANISYSDLQVPQLKELCEYHGVKKGGTKDELISRLSELQDKMEQKDEAIIIPTKQQNSPKLCKERLSIFLVEELKEWCRESSLPVSGNKSELVDRLFNYGMTLDSLYKSSLKDICEAEGKPVSGTVQELIERLSKPQTPVKIENYIAVSTKKAANSQKLQADTVKSGKQMSRAAYRKMLHKYGLVEDDQDVFHIIAKKNGGADHTDNYHFVQNKHMNRAIGYRFDDLNCYIAGEAKAEKAVAISIQLCGYKGPSAVELYKRGEERFREMHSQNRASFGYYQK